MTTNNNTLPTLTPQTEAKRLTLAVRDFVFDTRKAATLEDGAKLWASLEESFASALREAEERGRREEQRADVCIVCCGQPLTSGRECICGGEGTGDAEKRGLRLYAFKLEDELESSRAVLAAAEEWRKADIEATKVANAGRALSDEGRGKQEAANDKLWTLRFAVDALRPEPAAEEG